MAIRYDKINLSDLGVRAEVARFDARGEVTEWHVMLHVEPRCDLFQKQMQRIYEAEDRLTGMPGFEGSRYVMKRYFLSDSTNQQPLMRK